MAISIGASGDRRVDALIAAELQRGEVAIKHYSRDVAGCACPAHHSYIGVACIVVGRNLTAGRDRCLACGTVWQRRDYRRDALAVIAQGKARP